PRPDRVLPGVAAAVRRRSRPCPARSARRGRGALAARPRGAGRPGPGRRHHDHPDPGPAHVSTIALLPGDGIGPEVLDGPVAFLRQLEAGGAPARISGPGTPRATGPR